MARVRKEDSQYTKLREAFKEYHANNPNVYKYLKRFAFEAKERLEVGRRPVRLSIALLIERVRWEIYFVARGNQKFKIPNAHRAFYARYLMHKNPELKGMFRIAKQRSKHVAASD